MLNKEQKMHQFYMNISKETAKLSYANRNKVGAVLVKDYNIISFGYNGTPKNQCNICEDSNNNTLPCVVHSEMNIIAKAARQGISTKDSTLYVTLSPCYDCAKLIVQSEIKTVIYLEEYRIKDSIEFLKQCNIEVFKYSDLVQELPF